MTRLGTILSRQSWRREFLTWSTVLGASLLALVFVMIAREIMEGETHRLDEAILTMLRTPGDLSVAIGPGWLTKVMTDITALGGVTVLTLITLLVTLYLVLSRAERTAAFLVVSILGGWGLSSLLKIGVGRPRPELVPHLVEVHDLSFPSGHAMLSAVVYLTLGALLSRLETRRRLRVFFMVTALFLTLIIGLSRIFLGVHYPTDVLGGWCAGLAWASLSWFAAQRLLGWRTASDQPAEGDPDEGTLDETAYERGSRQ
ncbi:undecaprenyl-diphosphatase [Rhizobium sp. RU20A]|uniref:phosphatase PAP2 family protein n=1 Tax=Rhizobium sp. RU20A TaxID=1907412 RepID=UPI000953A7C8|nr:phosphatase PAP2 family protein [Rhizobium sp. RU20A]SIQ09073.1 undecaprenyl-diphosphatase [Rhizobium sp. RU20A]